MGKERLIQFDVLKGIGILLVLLGHTGITGVSKELIYGFHMPLFFFCSGVFYKQQPLGMVAKKCFKQLLVPWAFFCIVLNSCYFLLNLKAGYGMEESWQMVASQLNILDENSHYYLTIWFLICLIEVRLVYSLIECVLGRNLLKYSLVWGGYTTALFLKLPLYVDTMMCALVFYELGRVFFCKGYHLQRGNSLVMLLLATLYILTILVFRPVIDLKLSEYPWYLVFLSMVAILVFYYISFWLASRVNNIAVKFLERCGKESLVLLGLHRPLWLFVYPICLSLHLPMVLIVSVEMITALVVLFPAAKILNRYMPILIGK